MAANRASMRGSMLRTTNVATVHDAKIIESHGDLNKATEGIQGRYKRARHFDALRNHRGYILMKYK